MKNVRMCGLMNEILKWIWEEIRFMGDEIWVNTRDWCQEFSN